MMQGIQHLLRGRTLLLLAILYSAAISVLFFIPSPELPDIEVSGWDKVIHCVIYFILINLWLLYFYVKNDFQFKANLVIILLLSLLLYGIIVEVLQDRFTATRSADIFDVIANLTGSLLGIFFFKRIKHILRLKKFN